MADMTHSDVISILALIVAALALALALVNRGVPLEALEKALPGLLLVLQRLLERRDLEGMEQPAAHGPAPGSPALPPQASTTPPDH